MNVRINQNIQGIKLNNIDEIKCSMYAGRPSRFLFNFESYSYLTAMLDDFQICSSLSLNYEQTKEMFIGHFNVQNLAIQINIKFENVFDNSRKRYILLF